MKPMSLERARATLCCTWARLMCADGYPRKLRIDSVEADGCGGWHVSGLDSNGFRHGAYLRNNLTQAGA